ncbi:MAG TPA: hypothetical protein VFZ98_08075 [Vicinamibacterales bacterium]
MRAIAAVVAASLVAAIALASPQDEKKKKDSERVMIVKGCVSGSRLDVTQIDTAGFTVDHFKLRGNKDLMKVLTKDLNGHLVELTGVVDDPHNKQGRGKTIQIGKKTTITTGGRDVPDIPDPATDPTLTVDSLKDLEPHCASSR